MTQQIYKSLMQYCFLYRMCREVITALAASSVFY